MNNKANIREFNLKTLIIGGGIAGTSAALQLINNGFEDFLLIESRYRLGGRIRDDDGFSRGATWLHYPDKLGKLYKNFKGKTFLETAMKSGFTMTYDNCDSVQYFNGLKVSEDKYKTVVSVIDEAIYDKVKAADPKKDETLLHTVENYIRDKYPKNELLNDKKFVDFVLKTFYGEHDYGSSASISSVRDFYNTMDGNSGLIIKEGLENVFKEYAEPLLNSNKFLLDTRVKSIEILEKGKGIKVIAYNEKTNTKYIFNAENGILTLPWGVLKNGEIELKGFSNEYLNALKKVSMGNMNKLITEIDPKFFEKHGLKQNDHINIHDERLLIEVNGKPKNIDFTFLLMPAGKPQIICFFGNDESVEMEKKGKDFARKLAINALKTAFGEDVEIAIKDKCALSVWNIDPDSKGAYSNILLDSPVVDIDNNPRIILSKAQRSGIKPVLFMAGEGVFNPSGHSTTIFGAEISGMNAAYAVMNSLNKFSGISTYMGG